ncbi:MAG: helix-turn-helix domain-containing protein [Candidatus Angelobacter sp. Gp1-AA117]|nr:MAG: helix-turn-helix domain-containing protein [Candidatus Angelobacter sp. Gp1-AA117]
MKLSTEDSRVLEQCFRGGLQPVRTIRRALILRQLGRGEGCRKVATQVGVAVSTVYEVRRRYEELGLEGALYDRPRPGGEALLKPRERQQIIAMVCGAPPTGRARWTVRLIAAEAVQRALVPKVGRETIRVLLQNHDLQPWREKNVVRGEVGSAIHRAHGRCAGRL